MSAPREVELKLECVGPDLSALARHPLLQGTPEPQLIVSTYFDTADQDLRAAGLTLRVRRKGETFVQTVKSGEGGVGLFDRAEWEVAVAGETPDREAFADTPVRAVLEAAGKPALVPLFSTVVMRAEHPIEYGASRILATLDAGRVETPASGDTTLSELELELESGSAGDLFALAQALAETVPLRLGARSKSERGYALLDGRSLRPRKAEPVAIPEEARAADAFRLVALACLRQLRLNEEVFLAARPAEALHQMRVALRRLRSAFSLFKPILEGDPRAAALNEEIKRVTAPFGEARNLDVFLATTLPAEIERRPDEPSLAALRERLEAEHARAYAAVMATLDAPEWRALLIDLVAWIETGPWREAPGADEPAPDFAARVLERFRRRVKRRGRHLDRLDPEERHRVRIAAKKLRYGAEFFAGLYGSKKARKRHKVFGDALSDLQDHLGALNDLATAHTVMAGLAVPGDGAAGPVDGAVAFAAGLTAADKEAEAGTLLEKAAEAHDDLVDVKPFWR